MAALVRLPRGVPHRSRSRALNLYATSPLAFAPQDVDIALVYTIHAANALTSARLASGLQLVVHSRHLIGVAQGILMGTHQLSMEQSFELLRTYSSQENVKLRDLAQVVVEIGRLPEPGWAGLATSHD